MTIEEAIEVLTLHKENWERLIREHIAEKQEGNETVEALGKAIHALEIIDSCPVFSDDEVKQPCIESPCSKSRDCTTCKYGLEHFRFEKFVKCMANQESFTEWEAENDTIN